MSQSQVHDDKNLNKVDPNWRSDALNLELDYGMQTIQFSLNDDKELLNLKNELKKLCIKFE